MPMRLNSSAVFLILANLVPVFGVLFLGWDALTILVLYWLESVIMGVLNIPKILACRSAEQSASDAALSNLFTAMFYASHYGMFTGVHGVFLAEMFGARPIIEGLLSGGSIMWTAAIFLISHLASMFINFFGKKEYLVRNARRQMFSVYGRVFIMHIVVLLGGIAIQNYGAPLIAVIMLIALKTAIDLIAHNKEHESVRRNSTALSTHPK